MSLANVHLTHRQIAERGQRRSQVGVWPVRAHAESDVQGHGTWIARADGATDSPVPRQYMIEQLLAQAVRAICCADEQVREESDGAAVDDGRECHDLLVTLQHE